MYLDKFNLSVISLGYELIALKKLDIDCAEITIGLESLENQFLRLMSIDLNDLFVDNKVVKESIDSSVIFSLFLPQL